MQMKLITTDIIQAKMTWEISGTFISLFRDSQPADATALRSFYHDGKVARECTKLLNSPLSRIPVGTTRVWSTNQLIWQSLSALESKVRGASRKLMVGHWCHKSPFYA